MLLQSLPYRDADRLHLLQMLYPDGTRYASLSAPDFMSVRAGQQVFDQVEAIDSRQLTMLGAGEPREITGAFVSGGLFDMLGLTVSSGRGFRPEENQPGQGHVAILSHGFWQRVFGGDPAVLGRSVTTAGVAYTIIGVASPQSSTAGASRRVLSARVRSTPSTPARSSDAAVEFLSVVGRAKSRRDAARRSMPT